ncbi:hypothetical protein J6590_039005 [Homalodisca vitripennis]|nr:hypothetical protein J6590_039005 [Homalodisca vitripennis]
MWRYVPLNKTVLNGIYIALIVLAAASCLAQYDTYENSSEEDDLENDQPQVDYSKYFSGVGADVISSGPVPPVDDTVGFVQPLDFTGLFGGGHYGLDVIAGGASRQIFHTPVGVSATLPVVNRGFIVQGHNPSNSSGFVDNNVNFRSLFDTSSSSSEHGFRPQDFVHGNARVDRPPHISSFSPGFSSLQRDIDHEVQHQRNEEAAVQQSRIADRKHPIEYDSVEDSEDFSSSVEEDDEPPILDPNDRSPQKYKPLHEDEEQPEYKDLNNKNFKQKRPHTVGHNNNYSLKSQPVDTKYKKPPTLLPETDEDYHSYYNDYNKRARTDISSTHKPINAYSTNSKYSDNLPKRTNYNYQPQQNYYKLPSSSYYHPSSPLYTKTHEASDIYPKNHAVSSQTVNAYPVQPINFKPSPRDNYRDSYEDNTSRGRSKNVRSKYSGSDGLYSQPQTEIATVINPKKKILAKTSNGKTQSCKKIRKKMDSKDFSRFKRQKMTCYICRDKEGGNTYEECSYESQPKSKSFNKESTVTFSSDDALNPPVYQSRERRSTNEALDRILTDMVKKDAAINRKVRQYYNLPLVKESGHGPEHYRFGPEYFRNTEHRSHNPKRKQIDYYDEEKYDDDETEDFTDIEKEYSPPGASEEDDCHKVNKNGVTCMVCKNYKTGGSYEQCSYASDPDENRYEYATQSSYGSKRPTASYRLKRNSEKLDQNEERNINVQQYNKRRSPYKVEGKNVRDNKELNNGKLKRKKVFKKFNNKQPKIKSQIKDKMQGSKDDETTRIVGLDPFFYGHSEEQYDPDDYDERGRKIKRKSNNSRSADDKQDESEFGPTYEEAFYKLFPELVGIDPYTGESVTNVRGAQEAQTNNKDYKYTNIPYVIEEDEDESESNQEAKKTLPNMSSEDLNYYSNDKSKKDLQEILHEFSSKNRTDCKKIIKNKMTCYQCLDRKGVQHEECMLIAASEPKGKHLAYHEVKEFRVTPREQDTSEPEQFKSESGSSKKILNTQPLLSLPYSNDGLVGIDGKIISNLTSPNIRDTTIKDVVTKAHRPQPTDLPVILLTNIKDYPAVTYDILKVNPKDVELSSVIQKSVYGKANNALKREKRKPQYTSTQNRRTEKRRSQNQDRNDDEEENSKEQNLKPVNDRAKYNSIPPDPEDFHKREGPEGAYSHETEPVFDSLLRITLPKYMLSRSEHEEIFDEVLRSG